MDAAEKAYEAARAEIARVKEKGGDKLYFDSEKYRALNRLPPEIADFKNLVGLYFHQNKLTQIDPISSLRLLTALYLDGTLVSDLTPLEFISSLKEIRLDGTRVTSIDPIGRLRNLRRISLFGTAISDINPLSKLKRVQSIDLCRTKVKDLSALSDCINLRSLRVTKSQVTDLRQIEKLTNLSRFNGRGLSFDDTPATKNDKTLAVLSKIENDSERTRKTLAYLRSLPPWPEPYTPAATPDGSTPKPIGGDALVKKAEALSEKTPLAEELVQDPDTGVFSVRHKAIEKPDLLSATLGQVADAIEDVLHDPSNGLHDGSLEIRKLRRTLDRYANDPQRVEMDFTTIHQSMTRQVAIGDLPPSEAILGLMSTLQDAAQGIRATDPAVAANRRILQEQKLREMPAEALDTLRDAKPILEAMTEGDLNAQMREDLEFLTEEMRAGPPSLPGVTRDEAILGGRDEAVRVFGRSARMFIAIKKSPSLIHRLHDSAAFKAGVVAKALTDLIKWGLSFF